MDFGREAIAGVERLIRPHVRRTPVVDVAAADFGLSVERLNLKLELLQHSGSLLVDDQAIREAQRAMWDCMRVVAEPGGAAALAALLSGNYVPEKSERVGVLICGGNTTAVDFGK
jgi:Threonine dehydratase